MRKAGTSDPPNGLLPLVSLILLLVVNLDFARMEALLLAGLLLGAWLARKRVHWTARPPGWCAPLRQRNGKLSLVPCRYLVGSFRYECVGWRYRPTVLRMVPEGV
jgi:hypothetical protein